MSRRWAFPFSDTLKEKPALPGLGHVRRADLVSKLVILTWHTMSSMWKRCCTFIGVALLLWAGWPASAQAPDDGPGALRSSYLRPDVIPFPSDNPYSAAKVELGRRLFFEPLLSASRSTTCASCHNPALGVGRWLTAGDWRQSRSDEPTDANPVQPGLAFTFGMERQVQRYRVRRVRRYHGNGEHEPGWSRSHQQA